MWVMSVVAGVLCYETTKHLVRLYQTGTLRKQWLLLLISSIYPHYYTWWSYFNAWNDDFYEQWWHQALFSITELVSTLYVIQLCDLHNSVQRRPIMVIFVIAVFHIVASGLDQFISNVVYQQGEWYQTARDLGFMTVDLLHLVISAHQLLCATSMSTKHWMAIIGAVLLLNLISAVL